MLHNYILKPGKSLTALRNRTSCLKGAAIHWHWVTATVDAGLLSLCHMAVCGWELPFYWEDHFVLQWQSRIALISEVSIHFSSLSPSIFFCVSGVSNAKIQFEPPGLWVPLKLKGVFFPEMSVLVPEWRFLCYESFWLLVSPLVPLPFLILILWPWWLHELPNAVFCLSVLCCVVLCCLCVCMCECDYSIWNTFSFVSPPFLCPSVQLRLEPGLW